MEYRDIGGISYCIHIAIITAQTNWIFRTTLVNRVVGNRPRKSLIAIGVIDKDSDGRGVISVTFHGGTVHSVEQPIGGERVKCAYQPGWVGVCLFSVLSNARWRLLAAPLRSH